MKECKCTAEDHCTCDPAEVTSLKERVAALELQIKKLQELADNYQQPKTEYPPLLIQLGDGEGGGRIIEGKLGVVTVLPPMYFSFKPAGEQPTKQPYPLGDTIELEQEIETLDLRKPAGK